MTKTFFLLIMVFSSLALGALPFSETPEEGMVNFTGNWALFPEVKVPTDKIMEPGELKGKLCTEIILLRNSILAQHGFEFSTPWIAAYFKSRSWYKPGGYKENSLTAVEEQNIKLLLKTEADLKAAALIKNLTRLEDLHGRTRNRNKQITAKSDCSCLLHTETPGPTTSYEIIKITKKQLLGQDCSVDDSIAVCMKEDDSTVCPLNCVEVQDAHKLTEKEKWSMTEEKSHIYRAKLLKKVPKDFLAAIASKYPNWVPLVLPDPSGSDYVFKPEELSSFGHNKFQIQSQMKKRNILVFFSNEEDAIKQLPTIAYDGISQVEFQKFPFSMDKSIKKNPSDAPSFDKMCLLNKGSYTVLLACGGNNLDDGPGMPIFSGFELGLQLPETLSLEQIQKRISNEEMGCCIDHSSAFKGIINLE